MKKFRFTILISSLYFVFIVKALGQSELPYQTPLPFDSTSGKVVYKQVEAVDSVKKDELYFRAKFWIAENYKSANDVIQLDDKENGAIIAKRKYSNL